MTKNFPKPEKTTKLRPDANEIAFRVAQEATGNAPKTVPGEGPKNPEAVKRGTRGGKKGGTARAEALSGRERREISRKGAIARWMRTNPEQ